MYVDNGKRCIGLSITVWKLQHGYVNPFFPYLSTCADKIKIFMVTISYIMARHVHARALMKITAVCRISIHIASERQRGARVERRSA